MADLDWEWDAHFTAAARRFVASRDPSSRTSPAPTRTGEWADREVPAQRRLRRQEIETWAPLIAADLRRRAGMPPTNDARALPVHELAARLGYQVVYSRQVFDGHLPALERREIHVRAGSPRVRSRFTVGHELGHIWLGGFERPATFPAPFDAPSEERLCDAVAGHLLLPSGELVDIPARPDLAVVQALAESADVSLPVATARAVEVAGWRCLLITWRLHGEIWHVRSQIGGPWRARDWTLAASALTIPLRSRYRVVELATPQGRRSAVMQLGTWSRQSMTTLITDVRTLGSRRR